MKKIKLLLALFILLPATAYAYTVKSGDTFCGIARNFDIPCSELKQDNQNINDYNKIYPGDIVDVSHETMLGGTVSKPYTFSPNTVIRSSEINNNFDTLYTLVNGNIDNNNISASAAIGPTKINGTAIVATPSSAQTITGTTTISGQFVVDTTSGYFRVPKMTQTQRLALSPDQGAIVYDTSNGQFYAYEGSTWAAISPAGETATANTSTKGIVQESTLAEQLAGTSTGTTGARLYINPTNTVTSSAGVADGGKLTKLRSSDGRLDSSFGGTTSSVATLDTNTLVVQNPANATSTPTANKIPIAGTDSKLNIGWYDGVVQSYTAGEAIDTSSTPLAVYLNSTDGLVYKTSSAAATTTFTFIGFAQYGQTKTAGQSINIQHAGVVSNFSGLTTGTLYYLSTSGAISSSAGTVRYKIGKAVTQTKLLIEKGKKIVSGYVSEAVLYGGSPVTTTISTGFYPSKINIFGICQISDSGEYPVEYNQRITGSNEDMSGNQAQWVNGAVSGYTINQASSNTITRSATYLLGGVNSSLNVYLSAGLINESSVNLLETFSLSSGPANDTGLCKYNYIIEE